jgi:hypothetical protein
MSGTAVPQGIFVPGRDNHHLGFIDPKTLSTTPGGTIYGTTPGGTRIVYDRNALFMLRNSPLAKTPPTNLPVIPGVTAPVDAKPPSNPPDDHSPESNSPPKHDDGELFKME